MKQDDTKSAGNATAVQWHDAVADDFESGYTDDSRFRDRFAVWLEIIERFSDPGFTALDLGCGSGRLLMPLAERNARVVGIDGSEEMLRICRRKVAEGSHQNVALLRADLQELSSHGARQFDLIVASSVLEYIENMDEVLRTIVSSMTDQGTFVFSIPNRSSVYRRLEPLLYRFFGRPRYYRFVVNVPTRQQMAARLHAHGLTTLTCRYMSPTAGLSIFLRPLGLRRFADNLMLFACRKRERN